MGKFWPNEIQLEREMADACRLPHITDDRSGSTCNRGRAGGLHSNQRALHCQYRYPSPRRFGPFGAGPTPHFASRTGGRCQLRERVQKILAPKRERTDSAPHITKQNKGRSSCFISVFLSPRLLSYLCPPVWTATSNGVSLVLQRVRLSLNPLASILSPVPSPGVPLAHCATKSPAFAANLTRVRAHQNVFNRRAGSPLCGGFAF